MSLFTGPMHYHIDGHKDLTMNQTSCQKLDPDTVWFPLYNGAAACTPLVKVGDEVKVGMKIAERNDHFYLPMYSPVSGTVTAIEKFMTSGMTQAEHLKIQNDHKYEKAESFKSLDYEKASNEELFAFLKESGMVGMGGAGFPTYAKYEHTDNIDLLIINAVECEPYLTADHRYVSDRMDLLKAGVLAFFKLSHASKVCIAIKEGKTELIEKLKNFFAGTPVEIRIVPDMFPLGWERVLVYHLTGKRYDRLPNEAGVIVSNATTAISFGDALVNGNPVTDRIVTVSGDALNQPQNVIVPIGTRVSEIIDAAGGYKNGTEDVLLIAGGPMMGKTIPNDKWVICAQTNGITALVNRQEDASNCMRCGRCTEVCPVGLQPVRIAGAGKLRDDVSLEKMRVMDCVECGLCSYICPSKVDVTENVRRAKNLVRMKQAKNKKGGK